MNLGFKRFVLPMGKLSLDEPCNGIVQVKTLEEALERFLLKRAEVSPLFFVYFKIKSENLYKK